MPSLTSFISSAILIYSCLGGFLLLFDHLRDVLEALETLVHVLSGHQVGHLLPPLTASLQLIL